MPDNHPLAGKKILIIHFRVGKTDGVSIEIEAWKKILTNAGAVVRLCSGPVNNGADYVISKLEQQLDPEVFALDEAAFKGDGSGEEAFAAKFNSIQQSIIKELDQAITDFKPDHIIISNIFSVGEHISAAGAFTAVLDKWRLPVLAIHHDFWWENIRYKKPAYSLVTKQLHSFFPPDRPYIRHATINSIAQTALKHVKNLDSTVISDTEDFHSPFENLSPNSRDLINHCSHDKNDIVILQATRIVRRKNIEIAIDLVSRLNERLKEEKSFPLPNNRSFDPKKNQSVLVLAGYAEKRDENYQALLLNYAKEKSVSVCSLGNIINADGSKYSLLDSYPSSDIVTYPSEYEGFGNQFLEAVHAKKPIALFEYPVFKTDIAPKGFSYISLGDSFTTDDRGLKHIPDQTLNQAVDGVISLLQDSTAYNKFTDKNLLLGKQNFSHEATLIQLEKLLTD